MELKKIKSNNYFIFLSNKIYMINLQKKWKKINEEQKMYRGSNFATLFRKDLMTEHSELN